MLLCIKMTQIDTRYFKEYRQKLGFSNQADAKGFFAAKDIKADVDYRYIELLNDRLCKIIASIDSLSVDLIRVDDLTLFCQENIECVFKKLKKHGIIPKLNNQGRRPEEVYFSWMRGFVIAEYYTKALAYIFEVEPSNIDIIGDDDLSDIESFKRTGKADLQLNLDGGKKIRVEIQSGFQGVNDIKLHKVLEAKRVKDEDGTSSIVMHFDMFNGQVAIVRTDNIEEDSIHWVTRQQMEGQTVFNIDQNYFVWKLTEKPPKYKDLGLGG